jgi:hypothetical protein
VFVKDYKNAHQYNAKIVSQNGLFEPGNTPKNLPGQENNDYKTSATQSGQECNDYKITATVSAQNFDFEIITALSPELKQKMKALMGKGIDVNELFLKYLEEREQKIQQEKDRIAAEQILIKEEKDLIGMPTSRHVPAKIRRLIREEHGSVCSRECCEKPAKQVHHEQPFSVSKSHDPRYLKPLCKGHHELEHAGDITFLTARKSAIAAS